MNMKRLLVLTYEWPPYGGGGGRAAYDIADELLRQDNSLSIDVLTSEPPFGQAIHVCSSQRGRVHTVSVGRLHVTRARIVELMQYIIRAYRYSVRTWKSSSFDLCHAHFLIPTGIVAYGLHRLWGIPYILTAHGSDIPGFNPEKFYFLHLFTRPILRRIVSGAQGVVFPSQYLAQLYMKQVGDIPVGKVHIIPNGIDTQMWCPEEKKPYSISTGRLVSRKGFLRVCQVVLDYADVYPLHIVGDGPLAERVSACAQESQGRVVFHGWCDRTSPEYQSLVKQAAVFVLFSRFENMSISALEALSAGCVVIVGKGSGMQQLFGDAAYYVDTQSDDDLAHALALFAKDDTLRIEYQRRARARACELFSLPVVARQYMSVLL